MAVTTPRPRQDRAPTANGAAAAATAHADLRGPRYQAFALMRVGLLAGVTVALTLARLAVAYDAPRR